MVFSKVGRAFLFFATLLGWSPLFIMAHRLVARQWNANEGFRLVLDKEQEIGGRLCDQKGIG